MNKRVTDKLNQNVRKALHIAKAKAITIEGFSQFSYTLDWHDFPGSLRVTCHFESSQLLQEFLNNHRESHLIKLLQHDFLKVGIKFRDVSKNIRFAI